MWAGCLKKTSLMIKLWADFLGLKVSASTVEGMILPSSEKAFYAYSSFEPHEPVLLRFQLLRPRAQPPSSLLLWFLFEDHPWYMHRCSKGILPHGLPPKRLMIFPLPKEHPLQKLWSSIRKIVYQEARSNRWFFWSFKVFWIIVGLTHSLTFSKL